MCGIVGYFDRSRPVAPVGRILLDMLTALGARGPDSAGMALYGKPVDGLLVRVKPAEREIEGALAREIVQRARQVIDRPVGYYCAGMSDGARVEVHGSAGWGLAECMLSRTVVVDGHAGNGAAASIRGGTVVIRGDAAAQAGISMKGALLLIGGAAGYMAGFLMQRGTIIVCGDAGPALADSMYEGIVYVGGEITELGNDTRVAEATADELAWIQGALDRYDVTGPDAFRKVVSARKLWNYDTRDFELWKAAF